MALSAATGLAAYSLQTGVKKLDLSEELAEIIRTDNTAFLSRIGAGGLVASQLTHRWLEDKLNANTATAANEGAGAVSDSQTQLIVASGQGVRFKIGTLFKDNTAGKSEIMRVAGLNPDTDNVDELLIQRGKGAGFTAGTGETHAANFPIMILSHTKQEDWKPSGEDWSQERTGLYNFLTVMGYGINISRTRQAVSHAGVPSEFALT